jgi:hypothetical protein
VPKSDFSYRCSFCRDVLKPVPRDALQVALCVLGLRHMQCPHCFGTRIRPYGWLKILVMPFWGTAKLFRAMLHT